MGRCELGCRIPFPSPSYDSRSVLAVKGSLRRAKRAPLTAPGRSEAHNLYEGKGIRGTSHLSTISASAPQSAFHRSTVLKCGRLLARSWPVPPTRNPEEPKETHLRQAIGYAAQHGVEWVILTNGAVWNVYRMRFEQPVRNDLVFTFDLSNASARDRELLDRLFLLSKEGMAKSAIEEFQRKKDACNPFLVGATLLSEPVVTVLRRELRRNSPGAKIDPAELRSVLKEEVLKREVVEGEQAQSAMGRIRRASARSLRKQKKKESATGTAASPEDLPGESDSIVPQASHEE